jgi:hypothetical protein
MAQRKVLWIATDKEGSVVGVFPTRKKAFVFFEEETITLTKLIWNGYYHSEKPLDYDPYYEGKVNLFSPMF